MGMSSQKTADQLNSSTRKPPPTGPKATPRPPTPVQMPMALDRSLRGKTAVRDREGGGEDEGGAQALDAAEEDEGFGVLGEGGADRPGAEDDHADGEPALAAELVADGAAGEEGTGEDEDVAVGDPLESGGGGLEVAGDGGEGGVHDGAVDEDHEDADGHDGEDELFVDASCAPWAGDGGHGWGPSVGVFARWRGAQREGRGWGGVVGVGGEPVGGGRWLRVRGGGCWGWGREGTSRQGGREPVERNRDDGGGSGDGGGRRGV